MKVKTHLITAVLIPNLATASTVFLCNGTYTDQPCKDGREVQITPTEGLNRMTGKYRTSEEAQVRDTRRIMGTLSESTKKANDVHRCIALKKEREKIDRSASTNTSEERRFAIRQEQANLRCKDS